MAIESPITAADEWFVDEDKTLEFTVYKPDGRSIEDVTDWTFAWALYKRRSDDEQALVQKSTTAGITIVDGPTGRVDVQVAAEDTAALVPGSYNYVLRRADPGSRQVLAYGGAVLRSAVAA